ncbi:unnamed protein product [Pieris brassicae]|uniref:Uncharacterized protein n=1 Tax=Pieris brassicae TaxID=7116 RepID=A0A9P0XFZ7_PIEBR|nr:unnamed protein product [Pieris brassicae]
MKWVLSYFTGVENNKIKSRAVNAIQRILVQVPMRVPNVNAEGAPRHHIISKRHLKKLYFKIQVLSS